MSHTHGLGLLNVFVRRKMSDVRRPVIELGFLKSNERWPASLITGIFNTDPVMHQMKSYKSEGVFHGSVCCACASRQVRYPSKDRIFAGLNIARSPDQLSPSPLAFDVV